MDKQNGACHIRPARNIFTCQPAHSRPSSSHPQPHPALHKNAKTPTIEASLRLHHAPVERLEQRRNHLVQLDERDVAAQAAEAAGAEDEVERGFHVHEARLDGSGGGGGGGGGAFALFDLYQLGFGV